MESGLGNYISNLVNNLLIKVGVQEQTRVAFTGYFFNTGWMFAERVLMLVVSFFVGIYVARYLGPEKYGLLNFAFSFVFLFQAFSKLGLDGIVIRNLVQNPEDKNKILGTSITLKSIGSACSFLLIFLSISIINIDFQTKVLIIIIALSLVFSGFETAFFYFESQVKAKYNAIVNSVVGIISNLIKLILIFSNAELVWFAAVFSLEILLKQIGYISLYQYKYKDLRLSRFDVLWAKKMLVDSWPLIISGVAVMLYLRIDQLMIEAMIGSKEVGLYSAVVNISEIWYFIPVIITNSVFPAILDAKKTSKELYKKRMQQLFNFMSLIAVVLIFPIFIFGKEIIYILYGKSYIEAGIVLQVHIFSLLFVFMGQTSGKWLLAENYVKISMYRTLAGAITNIVANIWLIKEYGIIGAAISTVLSYMIAGFLFDVFYKKTQIMFKMKCNSFNFFSVLKYLKTKE